MPPGRKQKESALISFKAATTSETQVMDKELLTFLNIAYTPGRSGVSSVENMWKTFGLETEECDMYSIRKAGTML